MSHLVGTGECLGPYLIAAPASVISNWAAELARFAPGLVVVRYAGSVAERDEAYEAQMAGRRRGSYHVVLTTYSFLMSQRDRPRLAAVKWSYIVLDEGHRLKNAACKLNAELRLYKTDHRLLLTGTPVQNK